MRLSLISVVAMVGAACGPSGAGAPGPSTPAGDPVENTVVAPNPDEAGTPPGRYAIVPGGEPTWDDDGRMVSPAFDALRASAAAPRGDDATRIRALLERLENDEDAMPPEGDPITVDLDADGAIDLLLMQHTFFGPSSGYSVYTSSDDGFRLEFAYPGMFVTNERAGDYVVLRYEVMILAEGEPVIQHALFYSTEAKRWVEGTALYYASQTQLPDAIADEPQSFELATAGTLRTAPTVDDTPIERDEYGEPILPEGQYEFPGTFTLRGNAVATYDAGARGVVVAERGSWAFVAMRPDSKATANSLVHGMDITYDEATDTTGSEPQRSASFCGWIETSALRR